MALVQTATSFRSDHGTLGSWNPGACSVLAWIRINALPGTSGWPNSRYIWSKDAPTGPEFRAMYCRVDSVGNISFERSSYSGGSFPWATYRTNTTPVSATGTAYFVAVTLATSGTGRGKIYVGTRTTLATSQTLGTNTDIGGTADDLSAINWRTGNNGGVSIPLDANHSMLAVFDTVLTIEQIQQIQMRPSLVFGQTNKKLVTFPGWDGASSVTDYSGNGYTGTVTSGAVANHAAIVNPFDSLVVWEDDAYEVAAAATGQPMVKRWGGVPFMRLGGTTFGQGWG